MKVGQEVRLDNRNIDPHTLIQDPKLPNRYDSLILGQEIISGA